MGTSREGGSVFEREVRAREIEAIRRSRETSLGDGADPSARLLGLALSGGGIRSATFALGVLQALARRGLLRHVDYLSTVSGGGYIGSWLSAWVRRHERGLLGVEDELARSVASGRDEPEAIRHLRRFSNYLTPRLGLFSADTLAAVATYARNLALNLTSLVALAGAILLLPLFVALLASERSPLWAAIGVAAFAVALFFIDLNLEHRFLHERRTPWYARQSGVIAAVAAPLLAAAAIAGFAVLGPVKPTLADYLVYYFPSVFALCVALAAAAKAYRGSALAAKLTPLASSGPGAPVADAGGHATPLEYRYGPTEWARVLAGLALAVALGLAGLWLYQGTIGSLGDPRARLWHAAVWGTPATLAAFGLGAIFHVGIASRAYPEETREWWSRLGGWMLAAAAGWLALFAAAIYGPLLVSSLRHWLVEAGGAWIASTLAGVWAGRSRMSGGRDSRAWVEWIARIAPYVFVAGLAVGVAYAAHAGLAAWIGRREGGADVAGLFGAAGREPSFSAYAAFLDALVGAGIALQVLAAAALLAAVAALLSWCVDVNVFSLHMFYRNRLVRCYLGASNAERKPHPFTGFDPNDALGVADLAEQRPYHLVNTAMNLTQGSELAWQERKAASFLIGPIHSGYDLGGTEPGRYQETACYLAPLDAPGKKKRAGWLSLGTALTISGAAASPNMGYHTAKSTAFLLTVFNVRLGWWMQNTRSRATWARPGPGWGLAWMLRELLGAASDRTDFVYLSDGGHFENLGLYELVRRRCRLIIACDASQDREFRMEDLGNAIRKCRTDLGARIEIDTRPIRPDPASGRSLQHCAVGTIQYAPRDDDTWDALLLYVKPSLTGDEPADLAHYGAAHPEFPHQSTADQWFDESQFESYRKLGEHVMSAVLERLPEGPPQTVFEHLEERWAARSPAQEALT
jgi:predicted acylesterase/phospholipase RssA